MFDAKTRRAKPALFLVMLALAVFGWGLHYKLSLYRSRSHLARPAQAAKLLSQKERPVSGLQVERLLSRGSLLPAASQRTVAGAAALAAFAGTQPALERAGGLSGLPHAPRANLLYRIPSNPRAPPPAL